MNKKETNLTLYKFLTMKQLFFGFMFIFLISCNESKKQSEISILNSKTNNEIIQKKNKSLKIELNENLTLIDLLKEQEYKSLYIDADFKDYIESYWKANSSLTQELSILRINTNSEMNILDEKINKKTNEDNPMEDIDKLKGLFNLAGKGAKGALNSVGDVYNLIKLENEREKLFSGFSKEKLKIAEDFEKEINKIIEHSYNYIDNNQVKEKDIFQNYKSINEALKSDKKVKKELEKLAKMMDDFYKKNTKVKEMLIMNKIINKNDYSSIVEYGNYLITTNQENEIKIEPSFLKKYFLDIKDILEEINNPTFDIPIEDWSEEKRKNIEFIYNDVKTRLFNEVNSLDYR